MPIDDIAPGDATDELIDRWREDGIDWVIAIERCGPGADGRLRNMRGTDIRAHVAPLERLFSAGPWRTIAIGDGGNEIGMGVVPRPLLAEHVPLGEVIGCVVPADFDYRRGIALGCLCCPTGAGRPAAGLVHGDAGVLGPTVGPFCDRGDGA